MKKKVIFLCTNNSARSQMAEGLLRHMAGDDYEVFSAGMNPQGIHKLTTQVMAEKGIDVSDQRSKAFKEYMGHMFFDDAIIVCRRAEDDCPSVTADAQRIHRWLFEDPVRVEGTEDEQLNAFREVRDQIEARIKLWLDELNEARHPGEKSA